MRLATRASPLALAQARQTAELLAAASPSARLELVPMRTAGDRAGPDGDVDGPRFGGQDKGRWVRELERALLEGEVDLAVHSAKDVPSDMPQGLEILGCPRRGDVRDALCATHGARSVTELGRGARVGTNSLRRAAQLRAAREDLEVVALRGNVDTRLRRLAEGEYDAIVVALAGLRRLGRQEGAVALDAQEFVPAPGQGTLALQGRSEDEETRTRVRAVADRPTERALEAERELVRALEADCHTPVGAHATGLGAERLRLDVFVGAPDGSAWVRDRVEGEHPAALGALAAERVLAAGAGELLGR